MLQVFTPLQQLFCYYIELKKELTYNQKKV